MKIVKWSKKRKRKLSRKPRKTSSRMCAPCGNIDCDPCWPNTPAKKKIQSRMKLGLCPGCGKKICTCKHKEIF